MKPGAARRILWVMTDANPSHTPAKTVAIFATCLMDAMRPSVGFAMAKLIRGAGFDVVVPPAQTCCGQPAWNAGDDKDTRAIATAVINAFEGYDYVVLPSGSCGGMVRVHYQEAFKDDAVMRARAKALAAKTFELSKFLVDVAGAASVPVADSARGLRAYYHDSCAGLRELGIKSEPRLLLGRAGVEIIEGVEAETCCGFGGLFSIKFPDISGAIVDKKVADILQSGARLVLGGDLGCLMNVQGRLSRLGHDIEVRHFAEVLAGVDAPAIGKEAGT